MWVSWAASWPWPARRPRRRSSAELLILKAAFDAGAWLALATLLAGLAVVFVGMMRHTIRLAWARAEVTPAPLGTGWLKAALVVLPLVLLVGFAFVLPRPVARN